MSGAERSVILCTAGFDHTIRFWEAPTGMCHRTLQYQDSVHSPPHTPTTLILSALRMRLIRSSSTLSHSLLPLSLCCVSASESFGDHP